MISSIGTNAMYNERHTANTNNTAIVRPNVDTLYSKVAVDLSKYDVALTIPEIGDNRFCVFAFYDL